MQEILFKNADVMFTMNDADDILYGADALVCGGEIVLTGTNLTAPGAQVVDVAGKALLPGFVNTHHHLYQTMFRGIEEVQGKPLFPWLSGLYEFWSRLDADTVRLGSLVGFCELIKTGCTTTMDHHYVFPRGCKPTLIDEQFSAAEAAGIRFHATRGSMSLGRDQGGLPPNSVVQAEEDILADCERLIKAYHDDSRFSMRRLALAPCSPFSVTPRLMRATAELAHKHGLMLHTHLAETMDEEVFCEEKYGLRPVDLMDELGWMNERAWFAHCIFLSDADIEKFSKSGAGIAHCPSSNMKLGSGVCRTSELCAAGIKLGIAVDGSASNDGSNMWAEVRRTYLLNHLRYAQDGLSAYDVLRLATRGGAAVLGRDDIGSIAPGMAADIIAINLEDIAYAGCHDPASAIVCCGYNSAVDVSMINGRFVVRDGKLLTLDENEVYVSAHEHAKALVRAQRAFKT